MMAEPKIQVKQHSPGTEIRTINTPYDVQTILTDGIANLTVDETTARVSFIEKTIAENGELVAKFVINLAMPRNNLTQIRDLLSNIISQTMPVKDSDA